MPVCHFKRANSSQIFKGQANYGYCASKEEIYYSFKGNVMINSEGVITQITATAANVDERHSFWDLTPGIRGDVIADKGLIGVDFQQELRYFAQINLQTAAKTNMKETRSKDY
ncbi:MAG: transposase, partial [Proteobacteria bacterium]|nr:transposase [Pseudomonadota bacterium]